MSSNSIRGDELTLPTYVALDALRVGIADDSSYFRRLVRTMLVGYGIKQIEEGSTANDAFDIVVRWRPDVLLLDWNLGEPGGHVVLDRIRTDRDDRVATSAVIVVSAHSDKRHVLTAAKSGANDFIVKPVSARLLYERLKRLTGARLAYARRQGRAHPLAPGAQAPVRTVPVAHLPVRPANRDDGKGIAFL